MVITIDHTVDYRFLIVCRLFNVEYTCKTPSGLIKSSKQVWATNRGDALARFKEYSKSSYFSITDEQFYYYYTIKNIKLV